MSIAWTGKIPLNELKDTLKVVQTVFLPSEYTCKIPRLGHTIVCSKLNGKPIAEDKISSIKNIIRSKYSDKTLRISSIGNNVYIHDPPRKIPSNLLPNVIQSNLQNFHANGLHCNLIGMFQDIRPTRDQITFQCTNKPSSAASIENIRANIKPKEWVSEFFSVTANGSLTVPEHYIRIKSPLPSHYISYDE